ncbi:MAG TPA: DNRLRE domain-containing protein [Actinomycetales bacterium]|nr:DNRLRE domain-containing protein [Actinomycetales bacterium]
MFRRFLVILVSLSVAVFGLTAAGKDPARADGAVAATVEPTGEVSAPAAGTVSGPTAVGADGEVFALRTRSSRTYAGADGTLRAEVFPGPVHYPDPAAPGGWARIDNRLVTGPDAGGRAVPAGARWQNAANRYRVGLPETAAQPVQLLVPGGGQVSWQLDGASGAGKVTGSQVRYANAVANVDLVYEAQPDRVKETLLVKDAAAGHVFGYTLSLAGLAARQVGDTILLDRAGTTVGSVAAPFAADAAGQVTTDLHFSMTPNGADTWTVTLDVDPAWLKDPGRVFPVVVDPNIDLTTGQDCYLESGAGAAVSHCAELVTKVGYNAGTGRRYRSLVSFPGLTDAIPQNTQVLAADLNMWVTAATTTTKTTMTVHGVTGHNPTAAATWNTYDGVNAWTSAGGDFTPTPAATEAEGNDVAIEVSWEPTDLVAQWVNRSRPNYGFLIKQDGAENVNNVLSFTSWDSSDSTHWPRLWVRYAYWQGLRDSYSTTDQRLTDRSEIRINNANGNVVYRGSDAAINGAGVPLRVERFYNGMENAVGSIGRRWRLSIGQDVVLDEQPDFSLVFIDPSGTHYRFTPNGSGGFTSPPGINADLEKVSAGVYTLTYHKTGEVLRFDTFGVQYGHAYLVKHADKHGNAITIGYDTAHRMTSITDTGGRVLQVAYNADGFISTITDPTGRIWSYTYTGDHLTAYTDPTGKLTAYSYTGNDLEEITDPVGNRTTIADDSTHGDRVTSITYGAGTTAAATTTFTYPTSKPATCTAPGVTGATKVTDPRGGITTYCWDNRARVLQTIDALGHTRKSGYTPNDDVTQLTDSLSAVTTLTYDNLNNLTKIQAPAVGGSAGAATTFTYPSATGTGPFPLGNYQPTTATDAQGNTTSYSYTTARDLSAVTTPAGAGGTLTNAYQGDAGVTCGGKPGQLCRSTDGRGNSTAYSYDSAGNLTKITPPAPLNPTTITPDALGRPSVVVDGKGQTTRYTYDKNDRITQLRYAGTTTCTPSAGTCITYAYDGAGNLQTRVDNTGTTSFSYDPVNRPTGKTLPGPVTTTLTYDKTGNIATATDPGGTVSYRYNAANQLEALAEPGGTCTGYTLTSPPPASARCTLFGNDANGNRTVVRYPSGQRVELGYDTAGRQTTVTAKRPAGAVFVSRTYTYTNTTGGNVAVRTAVTDQAGATTAYTYDGLNRLTRARTTSGGTVTRDDTYAYDAASNRTKATTGGVTTNYWYNAANQMCWYGPATGTSCTTPAGNTAVTHDTNGNITALGAQTFAYNAKNQTSSITTAGTPLAMGYADADSTERTNAGTTSFTNTLLGLGGQQAGAGTPIYFTRDPDGNLISLRAGAGATSVNSYYTLDALGSVLKLTDATGNTDTATYTYDAYGQTLTATGTQATTNPHRYASGYHDTATGLTKFGTRYYHPSLGRWTQADPISHAITDPTQHNRYTYAGCSPTNYTDPRGLLSGCFQNLLWGGVAGVAFAGVVESAELGLAIATGAALSATAGVILGAALVTVVSLGALYCASKG